MNYELMFWIMVGIMVIQMTLSALVAFNVIKKRHTFLMILAMVIAEPIIIIGAIIDRLTDKRRARRQKERDARMVEEAGVKDPHNKEEEEVDEYKKV